MKRVYLEEIRKMIFNQRTLVFFIFLFVVNALLFGVFGRKRTNYGDSSYKALYSRIGAMDPEEALSFLDEKAEEIGGLFGRTPLFSDSAVADFYLIRQVRSETELIARYDDFRESIRKNAASVMGGLLTSTEGTFSYENAKKTLRDYDNMPEISLKTGPSLGIKTFLEIRYTDWIMLFLFAYCIFVLVSEERNTGNILLTVTTRYGGVKHAFCKLGAVLTMVLPFTAVFYGTDLLLSIYSYGLGDPGRAIQSVEGMRNCILPLSVGSYLLLFFALKALALAAYAGAVFLVAAAVRKQLLQYIIVIIFVAIEYALSVFVNDQSYIALLKNINICSFLDTRISAGLYKNINVFGMPVYYTYIFILISLAVLAASLAVTALFYEKNAIPVAIKQRKGLIHSGRHLSVLGHEGYKQLICGGGLFIIALFMLAAPKFTSIDGEVIRNERELILKKYLLKYEGYCTEEKLAEVEADKAELKARIDKRDEEIRNAASEQELTFIEMKYQSAEAEYLGVSDAYKHGQYLAACNGAFFYDNGYKVLFGLNSVLNRNVFLILVMTVFVVLSCSYCYGNEYGLRITGLINATSVGPARLFVRKLAVCVGMVTVMYIAIYGSYTVGILKAYGARGLMYPLCSIEGMPMWHMPVFLFMILLALFRWILLCAAVLLIFFISKLTGNYFLTVLVSLLVCGAGMLLLQLLIPWI